MFDVFLAFGAGGEKRRRVAAVQDADALHGVPGERKASWSAPVLWRFDRRHRCNVRRDGLPERLLAQHPAREHDREEQGGD